MLTKISKNQEKYFVDEKKQRQGQFLRWHKNGLLHIQSHYIDNKLNGEVKVWHENGQLWEHFIYADSHIHGEYKSWYRNGRIQEVGFYNHSYLYGEFKAVYSDGMIRKHCFYINGEEVSFEEIPYPYTNEGRMYFILKYNLPLLPVEQSC